MDLNRKFLIVCFKYATLLLCVMQASSKPNSCDLNLVDKCAEQLSSFRIEGGLPNNVNESRRLCNAYEASLECISDYASGCVDQLVEHFMKSGLDTIRKTIRQKCTEEELQVYHKIHSKCIKNHIGDIENCFGRSLLQAEMIPEEPPAKHAPIGCCLVSQTEHCVFQSVHDKCNPLTITYIGDLFSALTTDLKNLLCADFGYIYPNCNALEIKEPEKGKKSQFRSVLPAILEGAKSFRT